VLQPGLIKSFSDGDGFDFNARFVTALPTSIPRTTIVAIIQWTPFQDEDGDNNLENAPAFVYGPVVNLINTPQIGFDIDGLFAYGPGCEGSGSDYCHKFLVEGDLFIKIGSMMGMGSHWNSLSLYGLLAYVLTGLPSGLESKDRTVLLTGLSLPLAPWKK
ncbi:MAG: hypothetical protein ACREMR_00265, partial [Gemmatimonadales bacterium]